MNGPGNHKSYLGDSVYIEFDGYGFWLTTENGLENDPSNAIYLEPDVALSLMKFCNRYKKTDNNNG